MDKIQLLQERKAKILSESRELRDQIVELTDENSFVEFSEFSFSKNDFYTENGEGEGVITGFATINDYPFYIVAQNGKICSGGISKANCDKMIKCLDQAEKNATPVIYLLNSQGVQFGEGITVLEGLSRLLMRATQLKGVVPQYVFVNGQLYGSLAMLASVADVAFFTDKSVVSVLSPFVLTAKDGKNQKPEEIGGIKAVNKSGICSVAVKDVKEAKDKIFKLTELINEPVIDAELNDSKPAFNKKCEAKDIVALFEDAVELGAENEPDVKTVVGRLGGIAVCSVIFASDGNGVLLTSEKLDKIKDFAEFSACYGLPFVVFDDVAGVCPSSAVNNSRVMKELSEYLNIFDTIDTAKIAVVYKKAIGLGYSVFASKSVGFDYTFAFANGKIALFDDVVGAKAEFHANGLDTSALEEKYADETADPVNAGKDGYIDSVIEPQFVKQYLVASLQMLLK